jgi:hypothetical protein
MTTCAASNRPELRDGKLPRNTALLYRKPGKDERPSEYIGVLKLSREVARWPPAPAPGSPSRDARKRRPTPSSSRQMEREK